MSSWTWVIVVIVFALVFLYFYKPNILSSAYFKILEIFQRARITQEEKNCQSQVNEKIDILKAKLPSDSQVSIVNTKKFVPGDDINSWIGVWSSLPNLIGGRYSVNCSNQYMVGFAKPYICYDLDSVYIGIYASNQTMAIGIAIKIEFPSSFGQAPVVIPVCVIKTETYYQNLVSF